MISDHMTLRKGAKRRFDMSTDIKTEEKLGLSFNIRRGRVLVYHSTIRSIGEPEFIRFLFNSKIRHIAVQSCEPIDRHSFRVPVFVPGEKTSFEISSIPFLSVIYKRCHWDENKSYLVYGREYRKNRLVDFDLDTAREIAPEDFIDPEAM